MLLVSAIQEAYVTKVAWCTCFVSVCVLPLSALVSVRASDESAGFSQ